MIIFTCIDICPQTWRKAHLGRHNPRQGVKWNIAVQTYTANGMYTPFSICKHAKIHGKETACLASWMPWEDVAIFTYLHVQALHWSIYKYKYRWCVWISMYICKLFKMRMKEQLYIAKLMQHIYIHLSMFIFKQNKYMCSIHVHSCVHLKTCAYVGGNAGAYNEIYIYVHIKVRQAWTVLPFYIANVLNRLHNRTTMVLKNMTDDTWRMHIWWLIFPRCGVFGK